VFSVNFRVVVLGWFDRDLGLRNLESTAGSKKIFRVFWRNRGKSGELRNTFPPALLMRRKVRHSGYRTRYIQVTPTQHSPLERACSADQGCKARCNEGWWSRLKVAIGIRELRGTPSPITHQEMQSDRPSRVSSDRADECADLHSGWKRLPCCNDPTPLREI
jgi:hypothetical protein